MGHDVPVENHTPRPHHVAVVGSGPSGFYAAAALLDAELDVRVDMFDRLATPWGLVRLGVAPDHPKIKSVSAQYDKTARREEFRFFGHVHLGDAEELRSSGEGGGVITRDELLERYDAIVYAVGSQTERRLGIPGEDLPGSIASVDFVGWYNGHPDHAALDPRLDSERAVVIGAGNVALDVARMLLLPEADLRATDTADHALDAFVASGVRETLICGRRSVREAAFTTTELRELDDIADLTVVVDPEQAPPGIADDDTLTKGARRNLELFSGWAQKGPDPDAKHRMEFRFLRSPVEIRGEGRVEEIVLGINRLETGEDGRTRAVDTGERETVATGLVLRAVGYRGVALPGLPFDDDSGTVPHTEGRVDGHEPRVRRRVDQARAHRDHRHQQEGRQRDRPPPARRPRRARADRAGRRPPRRGRGLAARALPRPRRPGRLGGHRRPRARARRAPRPPAGQGRRPRRLHRALPPPLTRERCSRR